MLATIVWKDVGDAVVAASAVGAVLGGGLAFFFGLRYRKSVVDQLRQNPDFDDVLMQSLERQEARFQAWNRKYWHSWIYEVNETRDEVRENKAVIERLTPIADAYPQMAAAVEQMAASVRELAVTVRDSAAVANNTHGMTQHLAGRIDQMNAEAERRENSITALLTAITTRHHRD